MNIASLRKPPPKLEKFDQQILLPPYLSKAYKDGYLICVLLFGSAAYSPKAHDIDLAIVTRRGKFNAFVKLLKHTSVFKGYDVSLIKEEEIDFKKNFYFGGHGPYLVESLRVGRVLIGDNPFIKFPNISSKKIRTSIFERMREYVYVLRKSYFDKNAGRVFNARYEKTVKLSLYLLSGSYAFPDVLSLTRMQAENRLWEIGFSVTADKKWNIENLWTKINERYS